MLWRMTFQSPWFTPDDDDARRLEAEALAEIGPGHVLEGVDLTTVAWCNGCDDTVFRCGDGTFAIVHLSYTRPDRAPWPATTRLGGFVALELAMDQHEH
jgi:hypothetical protein